MDNDFLRGLKISLGIVFGLSLFFGIVYAVGFHSANEITSGSFVGTFDFSGATINGLSAGVLVNTNLVCNSSNEGKIKYNSTTKKYEGCNGNSWKLISAIPSYFISCKNILDLGYADGDKIYEIDPDGIEGNSAYNVYCDMTNGGWTLINDFGTTNSFTGIDSINTLGELNAAGYLLYSDVDEFYGDYFRSWKHDATIGYIEKNLPFWGTEIKVRWGNVHGSGNVRMYLNNSLISTLSSQSDVIETYSYTGEQILKIDETAIFAIYELWVK